nr:hypothetical protein [Tanacetum cinerariifolium]
MPTKIELTLEQSQQGISNDVLVAVSSSLRFLKPNEDGNPARANVKKALG